VSKEERMVLIHELRIKINGKILEKEKQLKKC
jgi:hypothetical protein